MTELRAGCRFPEDYVDIFFHKKVLRINIRNASPFTEGKIDNRQLS